MNKIKNAAIASDAFRTLLATAVIPSLIFWIVGKTWFIDRALFNLDYLVVCLVLAPFGTAIAVTGMTLILIIDILFSFAPAYHFSLTSVLQSINDLFSLEPVFLLTESAKVLLLVSVGATSMFLAIRKTRSTRLVMLTCLASAILLTFLDMSFSANAMRERDSYKLNVNIAASSLNNLRLAINTAERDTRNQHVGVAESASRVFGESLRDTGDESQSLILINVESLGEFLNPELHGFQLEPIMALKDRDGVVLDAGVVPFAGSTVPGELRELCGIRLLAVHPDTEIIPADECLPIVLRNAGYESWGIHGFIGTLFSRNRWYPALEFDNILFAPDLDQRIEAAKRCGIAFHGICDSDIWRMIVNLISDSPDVRKFVYWLTLSAHLPVENPGNAASTLCSDHSQLAENPELCKLVSQHRKLFAEIADSVNRGDLNNTRIVLVGDHSPPFLDNQTRSLFSPDHVPYIDIQIRRVRN